MSLARDEAKVNAIENVLGSVIVQGNSMYVKNSSGSQPKNDIVFNSISNILVNGEWIKTTDEHIEYKDNDGYRHVILTIEGEVRELKKIAFTPDVHSLSCEDLKCSTEVFNYGQNFYVYFKAPKDGYISVYLDDGKLTQRLLPYQRDINANTFKVESDHVYYFFSKKTDKNVGMVDEVELVTDSKMEQNRLFVLYSLNDFGKPLLDDKKSDKQDGYIIPKSLPSPKFQEWLQKTRSYNRNIELGVIDLTIKGK